MVPGRLVLPVAATLAVLDQLTKAWVRRHVPVDGAVPVLPGLELVQVPNLRGFSWWVPELPGWAGWVLITLLLLIVLLAWPTYRFYSAVRRRSVWAFWAASLLTGSAAGHLLDGVFRPYALDWIRLVGLPAFNVADLCAYLGIGALAVEGSWVHRQARGLGWRERFRRHRDTERAFVRYLLGGMRDPPGP